MRLRRLLVLVAIALGLVAPVARAVSVHGAMLAEGYNAGSRARIRASVSGADAGNYAVYAAIQYAGSKSASRVELHPVAGSAGVFQGSWPVAATAPTGLYNLTLRVKDASTGRVLVTERAPSFFVYRKLLRITEFVLDKAFYAPGERIRCEVRIQNLSSQALKGLRVEFSNENYPWISAFSGAENAAGNMTAVPSLGLVVLRRGVDIPAHGFVKLPMEPAGVAEFLQGSQVAVMGAGGPARHFRVPPPEVDRYTLAVWDHARSNLLDMQFSTQVIVRQPGRVLPKPYSRNYTHPYNDEIDFTKYREFYPPGFISPAISIDRSRTLYQPGDEVAIVVKTQSRLGFQAPVALRATIVNAEGDRVFASPSAVQVGPDRRVTIHWKSPATETPGIYKVTVSGEGAQGHPVPPAHSEIAFNKLPASLMVFCPHEDDEHPWAGLMRAMVEEGRPLHVVFYTSGDVGECERYFDGHPCDPVRAREFGTVRMQESIDALKHIGVGRDQISFLGLPDGGSGEIWFRHIHDANPFLDIYLAVDHSPYTQSYEPNLPYARDAVIAAVERLISTYHPAMIATPHPDERHVDHRTANWFTIKACQELLRRHAIDPHTIVLADRAYGSGGYKPAPYHYQRYVVYLSGESAMLKQEQGWIYQSQDGNLAEGDKQTYEKLPRQDMHYRIMDWTRHEGWNE